MQQVTLNGYDIAVQEAGEIRALVFTEVNPPSGNQIIVPLPKEAAVEIGKKMQGSQIEVAPASALRVIGKQ